MNGFQLAQPSLIHLDFGFTSQPLMSSPWPFRKTLSPCRTIEVSAIACHYADYAHYAHYAHSAFNFRGVETHIFFVHAPSHSRRAPRLSPAAQMRTEGHPAHRGSPHLLNLLVGIHPRAIGKARTRQPGRMQVYFGCHSSCSTKVKIEECP